MLVYSYPKLTRAMKKLRKSTFSYLNALLGMVLVDLLSLFLEELVVVFTPKQLMSGLILLVKFAPVLRRIHLTTLVQLLTTLATMSVISLVWVQICSVRSPRQLVQPLWCQLVALTYSKHQMQCFSH